MNLRRRINQDPIQLQLAPMIDVILFLLCFFLLTWNLARYEQDIEVKVPVARNGAPPKQLPGEVIINLRSDGTVELERTTLSLDQLQQKLTEISQVYPEQAVVLRGSESVAVEVTSGNGDLSQQQVQRRLEQVAGVSRVLPKASHDGKLQFTVESLEGRHIRPGLARAVVESGWNLHELHAVGLSLEEIFLQLTSSARESSEHEPVEAPTPEPIGQTTGETAGEPK